MPNRFYKLIKLADILDNYGLLVEASKVDALLKSILTEPAVKRFWKKVDKESASSCWIWTGAKSKGYGILTINRKNYSAHKLSWILANKKAIPKGQVVRHSCHTPLCVNPSHLTLGTQQHNVDDRVNDNRSARGDKNGRARITERDVKMVRILKGLGWTETQIAMMLDISRSGVANILHQRSWNWVTD